MGDCLGAPFEGDGQVAKTVLTNYLNEMHETHVKKSELIILNMFFFSISYALGSISNAVEVIQKHFQSSAEITSHL